MPHAQERASSRLNYLLNVPFILGLLILLINDHILKDMYGNWLTGKLSDFAGLLILPLFLKCLSNLSARFCVWTSAGLFALWKSPLATPFIDSINSWHILSIGRVIDYSDLISFVMLPIAYHVMTHINKFSIRSNILGSNFGHFLFAISIFAFIATSDDDGFLNQDSEFIMECCSQAPLQSSIGAGRVFVPNIFTPNRDGLNDIFHVYGTSNMARLDLFQVRLMGSDSLLFEVRDATSFSPATGWDGVIENAVFYGQYAYLVRATSIDSVTRTFSGIVCSVPCDSVDLIAEPMNFRNCTFGSQFDETTFTLDRTSPLSEPLDCIQ